MAVKWFDSDGGVIHQAYIIYQALYNLQLLKCSLCSPHEVVNISFL